MMNLSAEDPNDTPPILLHDTEPRIADRIREFLVTHGWPVTNLSAPPDATADIRPGQIVIVDVASLSGRVAERVGALVERGAGVVLTTGFLHLESAVHGLDAGAFDLVLKPPVLARIGKVVENLRRMRAATLQATRTEREGQDIPTGKPGAPSPEPLICHGLFLAMAPAEGFLKLLHDGALGAITDEQREAIESAMESLNRAMRLARDPGGRRALQVEPQRVPFPENIAFHAHWAVEMCRPLALAKPADVLVDAPIPVQAAVDIDQLQTTLLALVHRAIRRSPAGGHVTVAARTAADRVFVAVTDQGKDDPAIPETSLDLELASALARTMNGEVTIENPEEPGHVVTLRLPRLALAKEAAHGRG